MFGRFSCSAHHTFATAGRVLTPWGIALLHVSTGLQLSRPNRLSKYEGALSLLAFVSMLFLTFISVVPEGIAAQLELIQKDEIEGEQYIMLIHTYRCLSRESTMGVTKIAFEFVLPLLLCTLMQIWMRVVKNLNFQSVISRSLLTILLIHFVCYILHYIPVAGRDFLQSLMPSELNLRQILPFLASTVVWYPLSQLSAALCRSTLDKTNGDRLHVCAIGRTTELERSQLMGSEVVL
ncbi:unnamed protein product [Strongylus vulgaris]|uniref:G-protein coupled receptors family 1 profile domain-containing protein n=1 Tax=Strongylus vulgaris TaxID=40348 RepID=A0A3P7K9Y0_STRVU|nr:unnamed protein product [Strongylus vulgaris]